MHQLLFGTTVRHVTDEEKPATPAHDGASPPAAAHGVRDRFWFQALAVAVIIGVIGLLAVRLGHRDVVQN